MSTATMSLFLDDLRDRLCRMYPAEVRACLEVLTDEELWWRPNPSCNSVGNLVLHLTGNLKHYLGHGVAGMDYRRDRPAEFAAQGPVPRAELVREFEEAVVWAERAFEAAAHPERLAAMADLGPESQPVARLLVAVTTHFNGHVGQIIYVTKMCREGAFRDELWQRVRDR